MSDYIQYITAVHMWRNRRFISLSTAERVVEIVELIADVITFNLRQKLNFNDGTVLFCAWRAENIRHGSFTKTDEYGGYKICISSFLLEEICSYGAFMVTYNRAQTSTSEKNSYMTQKYTCYIFPYYN